MTITKQQSTFIASIKEKIRLAQYEALKEDKTQLIKLYWEIGKDISEKQEENRGKPIVTTSYNITLNYYFVFVEILISSFSGWFVWFVAKKICFCKKYKAKNEGFCQKFKAKR